MTPPPQQGPWHRHLSMAEKIGEAVSYALADDVGSPVDLGKVSSWEPETMLPGRPVPLRAIVVTFRRPLRDVLVFLTSYREDIARPLVETAAEAAIAALDVPTSPDQHGPLGQYEIAAAVEYETIDHAIDQTDALFLEASYALELPIGEILMIVGTGLLESATCFSEGTEDPFGEEPAPMEGSSRLELGDKIGAGVGGARYELGGDLGLTDERPTLELGEATIADVQPVSASVRAGTGTTAGVDAYDAMLAAQEHAEAESASAIAVAAAATARANVDAAGQNGPDIDSTQRWTELLSGVEVELSAELGRADLALSEISALGSDSVLTLDQLVSDAVDVFVNGTRYATARLVVIDGEYGIEIIEVVKQDVLATALAA
jgi:flagellar motor switch protein FliN